MTIPKWHEVAWPLLKFASGTGEHRLAQAVDVMADHFDLSPEERQQRIPSGQFTTIADRTGWAQSALFRAGCLDRVRRGYYRISQHGLDLLASNPGGFDGRRITPSMDVASETVQASGDIGTEDDTFVSDRTPLETIDKEFERLDRALKDELLARITASPPASFESLVVRLLVAMGFRGEHGGKAEAIGRAGDDGLDGVIDQDALGLDRVYLQAKRYARDNPVGSGAIRDFFGSLDIAKAAKGVFITTSTFTQSARETVERLGKRIVLIDGEQLATLMVRYGVGVRVEETFHVKKVDEDFFLE